MEKVDPTDRIAVIEKEIRETPYHKGTERHIGLLRAKLAKLRDEEVEKSTKKSGGGGGYAVKKQGDATIVLVGPPSVGKSTLLNALTNAQSKVAPYAFTTVSVIPGMMKYKNAYFQILDVPGLISGAEEGKGRGREVLSVVRGADLLVIMTDHKHLKSVKTITEALYRNGIRLNQVPPDVVAEKKLRGGIIIHSNIKQDLGNETIKEVAEQFGFKNAEITIREKLNMDTLIDVFSENRVYASGMIVINKADDLSTDDKKSVISHLKDYPEIVFISAKEESGMDEFRQIVWDKLRFCTIYLVRKDEEPGTQSPIVVKNTTKLSDVAVSIGPEFAQGMKRAKIWGAGAKFPGQEVSLDTKVIDGIQVRFV